MQTQSFWQTVKQLFRSTPPVRDDQKHVMGREEALDQTIDDSFPASDPPGHFSKSMEDYKQH